MFDNRLLAEASPVPTKSAVQRNRAKCNAPNCTNQAYARNRCMRHGAKKPCIVEHCKASRRFGSYCSKHADVTQKKKCIVDGCDKQPHARGKCVRHGGGRRCKADGCMSHARIGVFCSRHFNMTAVTNLPLGAPSTQPDWLDWAILEDLVDDALSDPLDVMIPALNLYTTWS
ncbi:hypothetical protein AC1031_004333 [Aphanomyces cochlioides]|nr:hypothetical protein AC1031_004333 [Aphanomyces cochlioides]